MCYGGCYEELFRSHAWPERGRKMMTAAMRHIVEEWDSVDAFVADHETGED